MNILPPTSPQEQLKPSVGRASEKSDLFECLLYQEQKFAESHPGGKNRIALFDLDNTLLVGDIGDAVFAQLLADGMVEPMAWKKYRNLCSSDPVSAYVEAVRALQGISLESLIRVTKRVLQNRSPFIACEGENIQVPRPNTQMLEIIRSLKGWHYEIYVVSASNDYSAKVAGSMLFDIPVNNIAGIKSRLSDNKFTDDILEPVPIGIGKVAQYRLMGRDRTPMIVATDSVLDMPILDMCDPDGVIIIVGENQELYERAKRELPLSVQVQRVPRSMMLPFQQKHRVA